LAFLSSFSSTPVPRSACSGPSASAAALPTSVDAVVLAPMLTVGTEAPSCLMRRSTWRA
jgi:hypothetical protein